VLISTGTATDSSVEWSPIHTRSERVPFMPQFSGKQSDETYHETLRQISAIHNGLRARSPAQRTHGLSSPVLHEPKIASIDINESQ
jgi:hypothetical protein